MFFLKINMGANMIDTSKVANCMAFILLSISFLFTVFSRYLCDTAAINVRHQKRHATEKNKHSRFLKDLDQPAIVQYQYFNYTHS